MREPASASRRRIHGTKNNRGDFTREELRERLESDGAPSDAQLATLPIVGQSVISAHTRALTAPGIQELVIQLSNGVEVLITPDDAPGDLPDWELFMPWGMFLACGPVRTGPTCRLRRRSPGPDRAAPPSTRELNASSRRHE